MLTPVVNAVAEVRTAVNSERLAGKTIGFVPTMGALHEGHAALIRAARAASDFVVVSIFVNPTQFGPKEDFAKYPRTLEADQKICAEAGANLIFAPTVEEIYPERSVTFVDVKELDAVLEGASRPGHFRGVCTVVLKLFNIVQPDRAHFGAKDYQQARIIRQMVRDLNVPVAIQVEPTVREPDGLAMSSRNRYLSPNERSLAPSIYKALQVVGARATNAALAAIPGSRIDYARIVDADTLQAMTRLDRTALAAVAVFLGTTRLIDNIVINTVHGQE
jgi:pantoate--beta-alanine ligase